MNQSSERAAGVEIRGPVSPAFEEILTPAALGFLAGLQRRFNASRLALLEQRVVRQNAINLGEQPGFPQETAAVRAGDWQVAPIPADLQRRRVEITGPTERKMMINALNSGASVFMADCE